MTRWLAFFFLLGCGGDCIPKEIKSAESFAVNIAPRVDVRVAHSADELVAIVGSAPLSFPTRRSRVAAPPSDPAAEEASAHKRLDELARATNFATTDIALVRAGADRASLRGQTTKDATTTIYFSGVCSPCGGGNPGSYEDARESEEAARAERTELVSVPKGSRVVVKVCSTECGTCPTNVP